MIYDLKNYDETCRDVRYHRLSCTTTCQYMTFNIIVLLLFFVSLSLSVHDMAHATAFHSLSTYLGAWMGSITATGSVSTALYCMRVLS